MASGKVESSEPGIALMNPVDWCWFRFVMEIMERAHYVLIRIGMMTFRDQADSTLVAIDQDEA